jgi:hypothetical protein
MKAGIDTTVTFTLEETAEGTRLRLRHVGLDGLGGQLTRPVSWPAGTRESSASACPPT